MVTSSLLTAGAMELFDRKVEHSGLEEGLMAVLRLLEGRNPLPTWLPLPLPLVRGFVPSLVGPLLPPVDLFSAPPLTNSLLSAATNCTNVSTGNSILMSYPSSGHRYKC